MKGKKLTYKERVEKLESDSNERKRLCASLCRHLAEGFSFESFSEVSKNTLDRLRKSYVQDFDGEEIEQALMQGRDTWERIGKRQAMGDCLGNSRSWWLNMVARYNWRDKVDVQAEHNGNLNVSIVSYASSKSPKDTLE